MMDNPEGEINNYRNKLILSQRDRFQHCIRENFLTELSKAGLNYPVQSRSEHPITRRIQELFDREVGKGFKHPVSSWTKCPLKLLIIF